MNELDHISHSQLNLWKMCPRQWEAKYIHSVSMPPNDNLIIGSCYHETLESNFKFKLKTKEDLDPDILYDVYSTAWDKYIDKNDIILWQKLEPGDAKDLGFSLVQRYMEDIAPGIQPKMVEEWFESNIEGTKFVLRMDLMDQNDAVIDHKTAARAYADADVHKDPQASAVAFVLKRPIVYYNHVAVKTRNPRIQVIKTMRGNADVDWWFMQAAGIINQMKSGYAPPRDDGWWCSPNYCSIYADCMKDLARTIYS